MPQLFANNARALLASGITATDTSLTVEVSRADLFPTANTGTGSVPAATNWFKATLQDADGNVEIVYVRTRTAGSGVMSNLMRGQEGTTARAFTAGTVVGLRITAADVEGSIATANNSVQLTGDQSVGGVKTFSSQIVASGGVQGNVTGNAGTVTNGVYTTGDQTIGGVKTFTSDVRIGVSSSGYRLDASAGGPVGAVVDIARFYADSGSTAEARILFGTAANVVNAGIGAVTTSANDGDLKFYTERSGTLAERARIDSSGNFRVTGNITADGQFIGNVTGNAGTVTNGVYTTGDQTIGGVKTFSNIPVAPGLNIPEFGSGNGVYRGNADAANSTQANLQIRSWFGIGFAPSVSGMAVPQNENAVWIDTRTGNLSARGTVTGASFSGAGTGLTGTASSLTAGAVTNGVYTTGDQTIGGVKTFSQPPRWGEGGSRGITLASNTDLNTITDAGWYDVNTPVNAPAGPPDWIHLTVSRGHNARWVLQTAADFHSDRMWFRRSRDGAGATVWQPWVEITNTVHLTGDQTIGGTKNFTGNVLVTGNTGGLGYGTGAGGTVTQATSKSTAVTLNRPTGQITMHNAALGVNAAVAFLFNNTLITPTDTVLIAVDAGSIAARASYRCDICDVGSGNCAVILTNIAAGSLSEAVRLNFAIIKGASS